MSTAPMTYWLAANAIIGTENLTSLRSRTRSNVGGQIPLRHTVAARVLASTVLIPNQIRAIARAE